MDNKWQIKRVNLCDSSVDYLSKDDQLFISYNDFLRLIRLKEVRLTCVNELNELVLYSYKLVYHG